MDAEVALRRVRRARFLRLAALHAGPLGPALVGRPDLAPLHEEAYASCPGAAGLACEGVGGVPRVCLTRRLEHLAHSALRGGKGRRSQEKAYVEGLLTCMRLLIPFSAVSFAYADWSGSLEKALPGPPSWRKPGWGGIKRTFPSGLLPVLELTERALQEDLAYLEGRKTPEAHLAPVDERLP